MTTRRLFLTAALATAGARPALARVVRGLGLHDDRPWLDAALGAERFIRRARQQTGAGVAWPSDPLKPDSVSPDLYNGMAGVVPFYLELWKVTGREEFLREAELGARELMTRVSDDSGLYTGLAGTTWVVERTTALGGSRELASDARRLGGDLLARSQAVGQGSAWNESTDIISGSSGIGLALLHFDRVLDLPHAREAAVRAGAHLLELGEPAERRAHLAHDADVQAEHAQLLPWHRGRRLLPRPPASRHRRGALPRRRRGGGALPHGDLGVEGRRHRDPSPRWRRRESLLPELVPRTRRHRAALPRARLAGQYQHGVPGSRGWRRGISAMGVPQRSPGFWENISQCCGNAGVIQFALDQKNLPYARTVTADLMSRATRDGDALKWTQAENRTQPENVVAQTGFMQGAAGVGMVLLHLDAAERNASWDVTFPDSPF